MTKSQASALRRKQAIQRQVVSGSRIPDLAKTIHRKGRAPQQVGIYGRTSMFYKTSATIDSRWSQTISNRASNA